MGLAGKKGVLALLHFTQDYSHVVRTVKKDQCLSVLLAVCSSLDWLVLK